MTKGSAQLFLFFFLSSFYKLLPIIKLNKLNLLIFARLISCRMNDWLSYPSRNLCVYRSKILFWIMKRVFSVYVWNVSVIPFFIFIHISSLNHFSSQNYQKNKELAAFVQCAKWKSADVEGTIFEIFGIILKSTCYSMKNKTALVCAFEMCKTFNKMWFDSIKWCMRTHNDQWKRKRKKKQISSTLLILIISAHWRVPNERRCTHCLHPRDRASAYIVTLPHFRLLSTFFFLRKSVCECVCATFGGYSLLAAIVN